VVIPTDIESLTVKKLSDIARKLGIRGWHEMRKAELIYALKSAAKTVARKASKTSSPSKNTKKTSATQANSASSKKKAIEIKHKSILTKTAQKKVVSTAKSKTIVAPKKSAPTQTTASKKVAEKTTGTKVAEKVRTSGNKLRNAATIAVPKVRPANPETQSPKTGIARIR